MNIMQATCPLSFVRRELHSRSVFLWKHRSISLIPFGWKLDYFSHAMFVPVMRSATADF